MTTKAMPLLLNSEGKHLELRNSAERVVTPSTQLKTGEDARAAAKRALEEFFGFSAPEDAIREGFQARVGNEVVAVYPIDANKMEMDLLRPAEEVATWAWRDVPPSMGDVVALGFPRNVARRNSAERTNGLVNVFATPASASDFAPPAGHAPAPMAESHAQYALLRDSVAAKAAALKDAPEHERSARAEELAQASEDLRLLAADMGIQPGERLNADDRQQDFIPAKSVPAGAKKGAKVSWRGKEYTLVEQDEYPIGTPGWWAWEPETKRANAGGTPLTARALIRQNDGSIIAARQKDGRSLLPGGHIENGETPEGAVARELQEELGLDIKEAMTGESYDFHGQDGSSHRVFVVDGSKLDLSKLTPGDDVEDAEFVNSPFTDSHGAVHPQENRENGGRFERPCPTCGGGAYIEDAGGNDVKCPKCKGTGVESVSQMKNDSGGDVAEIERHVEGIKHEVGELEKQNGGARENAWTPEFLKRNPDYKSKIEPKLARKWDGASVEQRVAWMKQTGSHQDDAELSFTDLTSGSHGSSQAEVIMELMAKLCGERINSTTRENGVALCRACLQQVKDPAGKKTIVKGQTGHIVTHEGEGHVEVACGDESVCPTCSNSAGKENAETPGQGWTCPNCGSKSSSDVGGGDRECNQCKEKWPATKNRTNGEPLEKVPGNAGPATEAGAHNHQYPDRLNGAFPVLLCDGNETIATQETTDGWRCENCGSVIAGPPKPETVIDQP